MKSNTFNIGEKYNRWTVLNNIHQTKYFGKNKRPVRCFMCECECGTKQLVRGDYLINGRSQSCGCLRVERARQIGKTQRNENSYHNLLYGECKRGAKSRKILFNLTKKEHYDIITKPCSYCGQKPILKENHSVGIPFPHLGIDRIDNNEGYEIFNCTSCCTTCNKMKLNLSLEDFTNHIMKISFNLNNK